MAEALAKRNWPDCRIKSVGTDVVQGRGAAKQAIAVMDKIGLDIRGHRTASITDVDPKSFQFIVALSKRVRRNLIEHYAIEESKIRNLFVDDPFQDDIGQYVKCRNAIAKGFRALRF